MGKDINLYEFQQYCKEHTAKEIAEHFGISTKAVFERVKAMNKAGIDVEYVRVRSPYTSKWIIAYYRRRCEEEYSKLGLAERTNDKKRAVNRILAQVSKELCDITGKTPAQINSSLTKYKYQRSHWREYDKEYAAKKQRDAELQEKKEVFGEQIEKKRSSSDVVRGSIERPSRNLPDLWGNFDGD